MTRAAATVHDDQGDAGSSRRVRVVTLLVAIGVAAAVATVVAPALRWWSVPVPNPLNRYSGATPSGYRAIDFADYEMPGLHCNTIPSGDVSCQDGVVIGGWLPATLGVVTSALMAGTVVALVRRRRARGPGLVTAAAALMAISTAAAIYDLDAIARRSPGTGYAVAGLGMKVWCVGALLAAAALVAARVASRGAEPPIWRSRSETIPDGAEQTTRGVVFAAASLAMMAGNAVVQEFDGISDSATGSLSIGALVFGIAGASR